MNESILWDVVILTDLAVFGLACVMVVADVIQEVLFRRMKNGTARS